MPGGNNTPGIIVLMAHDWCRGLFGTTNIALKQLTHQHQWSKGRGNNTPAIIRGTGLVQKPLQQH